VKRLTNTVRDYAWGSHTAIASLRQRPVPSVEPEAELWMGAHPSAPSVLPDEDGGIPLTDFIAKDPFAALGQQVLDRFGPRLPYLMKLLAAAQPLSLQAHPDLEQAAAGYAAERAAGLAIDDPASTYPDANHKPELLVAVEEFDALCGFRDPEQSADLLESLAVPALVPVVAALRTGSVRQRLRSAVDLLMAWPDGDRSDLVAAVAASGHPLGAQLGRLYPGDLGVLVALLLNQIRLRPDEAVFMPAGNLHAYLSGFGVEVMAASDNVLRGGLTPKRVDVAELLRVLRYEVLAEPVVRPVALGPGLVTWPAPVPDFSLTRAQTSADMTVRLPAGGPRILCCLRGPAQLSTGASTGASTGVEVLRLDGGDSVFVGAGEPAVEVSGPEAIVFQSTSMG
jgi:mannose-6-phosphate isomerase